jgi:hypothetical protein
MLIKNAPYCTVYNEHELCTVCIMNICKMMIILLVFCVLKGIV